MKKLIVKLIAILLLTALLCSVMTSCESDLGKVILHPLSYTAAAILGIVFVGNDEVPEENPAMVRMAFYEFEERFLEPFMFELQELNMKGNFGFQIAEYTYGLHPYDKIYEANLCIYNDEYVVMFGFNSKGEDMTFTADFSINLYYYTEQYDRLGDFESQRNGVEFVNTVIGKIAYDPRVDGDFSHFERLFEEREITDNPSYFYEIGTNCKTAGYEIKFDDQTADSGVRYDAVAVFLGEPNFYQNCYCYQGKIAPAAFLK